MCKRLIAVLSALLIGMAVVFITPSTYCIPNVTIDKLITGDTSLNQSVQDALENEKDSDESDESTDPVPMLTTKSFYLKSVSTGAPVKKISADESVTMYPSLVEDDSVLVLYEDELYLAKLESLEEDKEAIKNMKYENITYYTVNGALLDLDLQRYGYSVCVSYGIEEYWPYILCEMYQESRFHQSSVSIWGDYGLMQLNKRYHEYFKKLAGVPDADVINDPYANILCGIAFINYNLSRNGYDWDKALTDYYKGSGYAAASGLYQPYIDQVRQWEDTLAVYEIPEEE